MADDGGVLYLVVSGAPAPEGIPALVTACQAAGWRVVVFGRSESWLSQVQRGKRGVDNHGVLVRLAEVPRVDIEEFTGSGGQDETGRRAYPAASLIEQAMMGYGTSGQVDGGGEPGRNEDLDFLRAQASSA